MSQKKNEQNAKEYVSDSFVDTIWDQYEDTLQRSRKLRENRYEAYEKAFEEAVHFNSEFRNAVKSFYGETKKVNEQLMNTFQQSNYKEGHSEEPIEGIQTLRNQWQDVANRWEKIMLTPVRTSLDIAERFEKRAVENSQSYLQELQKRQKERSSTADQYIKLARTTQQRYLRRFEDSIKVLTGTGE
jgi:hypothetical protein